MQIDATLRDVHRKAGTVSSRMDDIRMMELATELLARYTSLGLPLKMVEKLVMLTLKGTTVKVVKKDNELGVFIKDDNNTTR
tara:strand:- start:552 stop:797 length:246 start_codon:yes stop_codon:yes gene_type:complete